MIGITAKCIYRLIGFAWNAGLPLYLPYFQINKLIDVEERRGDSVYSESLLADIDNSSLISKNKSVLRQSVH